MEIFKVYVNEDLFDSDQTHNETLRPVCVSNIGSGNEFNWRNNEEVSTLVKTNDTSLLLRMWEELNEALSIPPVREKRRPQGLETASGVQG